MSSPKLRNAHLISKCVALKMLNTVYKVSRCLFFHNILCIFCYFDCICPAGVIIFALCCTSSVFHSGRVSQLTALPIMSDLSEPGPGRAGPGRAAQRRELFSTQFTVRANWCSGLNLSIMADGGRERIMRRQTQWERRGEERWTGRMMG